MLSDLVLLTFDKIMQNRSYTMIILGTSEKKFAIYTEPSVGKTLQSYLTETPRERPQTHDLIDRLFQGFQIKLRQVVINDLQDTVYYARLFLEQEIDDYLHIVEIDARPSDSITLALMYDVPIYCTRDVLNKIVPVDE